MSWNLRNPSYGIRYGPIRPQRASAGDKGAIRALTQASPRTDAVGATPAAAGATSRSVRLGRERQTPPHRHQVLVRCPVRSRAEPPGRGRPAFDTGNGTLTPSAEIGVRHDGGNAETGAGLEVGGGLRYEGWGFSIEASARTLVAHKESGYDEWSASCAIRIDPGASGRGLSLSIAPTWGAAGSGVDRLWGLTHGEELGNCEFEAERRLEAELGYGIFAPRHRPTNWPGRGRRACRRQAPRRFGPGAPHPEHG